MWEHFQRFCKSISNLSDAADMHMNELKIKFLCIYIYFILATCEAQIQISRPSLPHTRKLHETTNKPSIIQLFIYQLYLATKKCPSPHKTIHSNQTVKVLK